MRYDVKSTLILWVVFAAAISAVGQTRPVIRFEDGRIQIVGLPFKDVASTSLISQTQWQSFLCVYTSEAYQRNTDQPIAGKYEWNRDTIFFQPLYAFSPGETYHEVFNPESFFENAGITSDALLEKVELSFSIPAEVRPLNRVKAIYPESASLPENLLRMYIYFSNPMMPGEAYRHISLMDENGTRVEKAFLVVDQELWDTERKRFTLLFDPGRIKRELKSNVDLGTPLKEGGRYHLVIDSAWRDVYGNSLATSINKTFTVTAARRSKVSPAQWKVIAPLVGSLGDVIIFLKGPSTIRLALNT